ncbi:MAG: MFS transporter, partial [Vicinamibacterales bacterium]
MTQRDGLLTWWHESDLRARRAFIAAALGWMLDSFDVMLYALVLAALLQDPVLQLTSAVAGILGSITLLAAAAGGVTFGVIADRFGRRNALMAAVLIYSVFTAACGFAQTVAQLAVFRILLGFGMGGEWATGVALVSETFPARHRGKALAFVQSSWAIGYGLAALVNLIVMPLWGWRGVFFVGVLPALFTIWIRAKVEEPALWRASATEQRGQLGALFAPHVARITVFITLMNACTLFGWWGFNTWIPAYLNLSPDRGGVGLSSSTMSIFMIVMQVGMWFGYVSFGFIADAIGRKRTYVIFLLMAGALLPLYSVLRTPVALLVLGPFVAFFGTGYYSGFGAVIAELYPTSIRATAAGVCYNVGRIASAAAPLMVGSMAG